MAQNTRNVAMQFSLKNNIKFKHHHSFFPKEQKCAGLERFGEKCTGLRFFSNVPIFSFFFSS